jgi:hypothetical protein
MRFILRCLVLGLAAAAIGCGAGTSGTQAAAQPVAASATTAPLSAAPTAWREDLPKEQKMLFMEQVVMPRMGKVFQAHDAKRYAEVSCETCHGPDGKDPKEHLPALVLRDGKLKAFADAPVVSKFMAERVVPEMAAVMGQKPYDPQTKQGFGCGACHRMNKQD